MACTGALLTRGPAEAATDASASFAHEERSMTDAASQKAPVQGRFRRAFATIWSFMEALESGGSGYTFDRIEALERDVRRLNEELRQIRNPVNGAAALDR
jgi:hypothetical protein